MGMVPIEPTATNVEVINGVVGNPFSDPVIPYQAGRINRTLLMAV